MSKSFTHILSNNACISWVQHSSAAVNTASNGTGLSESADDDLPSVMTCANYLKLPPYSTKVMIYLVNFIRLKSLIMMCILQYFYC
jgi:hypothetical protein